MRVLILGGTVFIGRAAAVELAAAGHELCFLHRGEHERDDLPSGVHVHADRKDLPSVRDEILGFGPDVVLDNMAISGADASTAVEVFPDDVRFVVTSSMDVYRAYTYLMKGEAGEPVPIDETSPVRDERYPFRGQGNERMDSYEKLDVEDVYGARGATILRLPMVYGENDYQRREEPILRRIRAGRKRIPMGAGTWLGTKGYVGDVARGIRLACESDAARGEVLNLGESNTDPMSVWAQMVLDAASSDAELVRVADDKLPSDLELTGTVLQDLLVDSSKARRLLGWEETDPRHAIERSVKWHLAHPPEPSDDDFSADDEALAGLA
jgi:nucleoside-diphosphate-sugar epimerase